MAKEQHFEDHVPREQHMTACRTITETDIVLHAGQTGDFYPHHVDAEWCKSQPVGQRIAHGTLIFSVGMGMTASTINLHAMSYGYDCLRFIKPVSIGNTLRLKVTVGEKRNFSKRPSHGIVVECCEIMNQQGEAVLACEHRLLVERKAGNR